MTSKVLLVNKFYAPTTGGIETAVNQYAHWYQEAGHDITVLCCASERYLRSRHESVNGIPLIRSASLGNLLSVPISFAFFWHFLRLALKADIVHINLQFPAASLALYLFSKLIRARTIVSYHCDVYRQRNLKRLTYFFDRHSIRNADIVITGSPALRQHSEVLRTIQRPMQTLPYSVDERHVRKCLESPPKIAIPEHFRQDGYLLFFGRLVTYKGTESLERAFRRLMAEGKAVNLLVFGTGPEEHRFRQLANEFPQRLHFVNEFVSDIDKYHLIRNCKVFLFPSVYYSEAFGITQLDAMACGRAIINCWLETGVNWVAPQGEGAFTLNPEDDAALAKLMNAAFTGGLDLDEAGRQGHRRFQELFSEDRVREQFCQIIASLAGT